MTKEELTNLLQSEIPLCQFMGLDVVDLTKDSIATFAPLAPNINMHQTGFAGSLYALAVATGWALVHSRVKNENLDALLVVKKATITYKRPVSGDISLKTHLNAEPEQRLADQLHQTGKANIPLKIEFSSEGKKCGYLEADYTLVGSKC